MIPLTDNQTYPKKQPVKKFNKSTSQPSYTQLTSRSTKPTNQNINQLPYQIKLNNQQTNSLKSLKNLKINLLVSATPCVVEP